MWFIMAGPACKTVKGDISDDVETNNKSPGTFAKISAALAPYNNLIFATGLLALPAYEIAKDVFDPSTGKVTTPTTKCTSDSQCPSGQTCGSSGVCSGQGQTAGADASTICALNFGSSGKTPSNTQLALCTSCITKLNLSGALTTDQVANINSCINTVVPSPAPTPAATCTPACVSPQTCVNGVCTTSKTSGTQQPSNGTQPSGGTTNPTITDVCQASVQAGQISSSQLTICQQCEASLSLTGIDASTLTAAQKSSIVSCMNAGGTPSGGGAASNTANTGPTGSTTQGTQSPCTATYTNPNDVTACQNCGGDTVDTTDATAMAAYQACMTAAGATSTATPTAASAGIAGTLQQYAIPIAIGAVILGVVVVGTHGKYWGKKGKPPVKPVAIPPKESKVAPRRY